MWSLLANTATDAVVDLETLLAAVLGVGGTGGLIAWRSRRNGSPPAEDSALVSHVAEQVDKLVADHEEMGASIGEIKESMSAGLTQMRVLQSQGADHEQRLRDLESVYRGRRRRFR